MLGLDPGLTRCGVAVVDGPPHRPSVVHADCLRTSPDLPIERRLLALQTGIEAALARFSPDVVACERVLFSKNVRTAMATGEALGVALVAAARVGLSAHRYSPTDVKLTVAGHGAADKDAVARMVTAQLGLAVAPKPVDVTDALAVALCHLARTQRPGRGTSQAAADDWSAVLDNPHVRIAGGTAPGRDLQ